MKDGLLKTTFKSNSLFEERKIQKIIKQSQANIVTVSPKFFVIEPKLFF